VFGWKIEADPRWITSPIPAPNRRRLPKIDGEMFKGNDLIVYIDTDDIRATLAEIEAHGAKALLPKTEIPTIGMGSPSSPTPAAPHGRSTRACPARPRTKRATSNELRDGDCRPAVHFICQHLASFLPSVI
jgi:hypothetical protein